MCTQINNNEPAQGIENFPRDINVLLALRTYQGMTDEEINMVLDYKIQQEKTSAESLAFIAAQTVYMNEDLAIQEASCKRLEAALQSLIDKKPEPVEFKPPTALKFQPLETLTRLELRTTGR